MATAPEATLIIDTSALVAIARGEPAALDLARKILKAMAAPNFLEAYMVMKKHWGDRTRANLEGQLMPPAAPSISSAKVNTRPG